MQNNKELVTPKDLLLLVEEFATKTSGLKISRESDGEIKVFQKIDSKEITIKGSDLNDVIFRKDPQSKDFIQINLASGDKILLTDQLVGFKPFPIGNLDVSKLPKVVTTVDLFAVLEAIEEMNVEVENANDSEALKNIFNSILLGAEKVGFNLSLEKTWLRRIPAMTTKIVS